MTRRLVTAVADPRVDVLGHCTGRQLRARHALDPDTTTELARRPSTFDADVVFAACARFDTAVEINCRPERQDPPDDLLDLALEWGCRVAVDTDAHAPGQLEWQVLRLREGGPPRDRPGHHRQHLVGRRPRRVGRRPPHRVGSRTYVEADLEAQDQRPPQAGQPRHQAQRRSGLSAPAPPPPPTRRVGAVEVRHGVVVADPYRWLEADGDPEVLDWVATQNDRTAALLHSLPARDGLHADLVRLLRVGASVAPSVAGGSLFTLERWGDRDQAALVVRPAVRHGSPRTLVDPQQLTGDRTGAIDWYHPSDDGRMIAFGVSTGGDERSTLHVLDVARGELLDDRIPDTRAASVAWEPDGSGFLYTRYPDPATTPLAEQGYRRRVYGHRLGQPWRRDELVWDRLPDDTAWATVELSRDGRWLLVHLAVGWSRTDVHLVDRSTGARTVLIEGVDARSSFTVLGDRIVGVTTLDADRGRVVAAPLPTAWKERWETLVPEGEPVLEAVAPTPRSLLVLSTVDAVARLDRYAHDGSDHHRVPLPGPGAVAGLTTSRDRDEAFVSFTSFALPPTTFRWATDGTETRGGSGARRPPRRPAARPTAPEAALTAGRCWWTGAGSTGPAAAPGATTWSSRSSTRRPTGPWCRCSSCGPRAPSRRRAPSASSPGTAASRWP